MLMPFLTRTVPCRESPSAWSPRHAEAHLCRGYFGSRAFLNVFGLWNVTLKRGLSCFLCTPFFTAFAAFCAVAFASLPARPRGHPSSIHGAKRSQALPDPACLSLAGLALWYCKVSSSGWTQQPPWHGSHILACQGPRSSARPRPRSAAAQVCAAYLTATPTASAVIATSSLMEGNVCKNKQHTYKSAIALAYVLCTPKSALCTALEGTMQQDALCTATVQSWSVNVRCKASALSATASHSRRKPHSSLLMRSFVGATSPGQRRKHASPSTTSFHVMCAPLGGMMTAVPHTSLAPLRAGPGSESARRLGACTKPICFLVPLSIVYDLLPPGSWTEAGARSKHHLAWTVAHKVCTAPVSVTGGTLITHSELVGSRVPAYLRNQSDAEHPTLHLPLKPRQPARISPCEPAIGRCG